VSRIVDTSVALKWFIIEENHEAAKALIGEALVAPDLLLIELSNAVWKKWRKQEIGAEQGVLAQGMTSSFVEFLPSRAFAERALSIAFELAHPVHDCFYLAAAEAHGLPVVTADARLIAHCSGSRFAAMLEPLDRA
jgi:predicted nucleic acid-binding protein